MQPQRYVGEILVRRGALEEARMEELLRAAEEKSARLLDVIFAMRETEPAPIVRALADEVGIPFLETIKAEDVAIELIDKVPITFARQHRVLPLRDEGARVRVAVSNPLDPAPLDDLRALLGKPIEPVAATAEAIEDAINTVYERKDQSSLGDGSDEEGDEIQDLIDMKDEAPVIAWVNNLFFNASKSNASDIHIEPGDKEVSVRNRIDGRLIPVKSAPKSALNSIVSRVKIEAGLNIAEKRLPQDGRITKKIKGRLVDVRVSTIPTNKGERIVMRLLEKEKVLLNLTDLGYSGTQLETIHHIIERPNGIVLVTGPTGSGKTTTLYACLNRINTPDLNILTAEDPVEYDLPGISQLQIHPKIGLTFAASLRSFLRQDPDVIMVGEIRDHETAEIAIHASLTGHLVFSTLHTNDAAGAITRLVEMQVQPFLISSSLLAVIAQRLVRRLCPLCRRPYEATDEDMRQLGVERERLPHLLSSAGVQPMAGLVYEQKDADDVEELEGLEELEAEPTFVRDLHTLADSTGDPALRERAEAMAAFDSRMREQIFGQAPAHKHHQTSGKTIFYRPAGCEACSMTGYRGRVAIAEILLIDEPVRREILNQSDAATISRAATSRGMRLLREDGARQVALGITSVEEVLAATQATELES